MRKTVLIFVSALILTASHAFCQNSEKMAQEYVVRGTIILKGKEIDGYIKKMGHSLLDDKRFSSPWEFQKTIRFISKDIFENKQKIKNKDYVKYSPKDIDGYHYNDDSLIYISAKYSDMSAVGTGMIAKRKFMRKISDGKISLFLHYQSPPSVSFEKPSELQKIYTECAENPDLVFRKGADGKLKLVNSLNVEKEFEDCQKVVLKFKNEEYGTLENNKEKKSKLTSLVNKVVFRDEARLKAIKDYNETCGE
ncbi:hypothetical protein AAG747_03660 [Rapidithrix thailandica]|uniref:Uncharacterized protein n=1 Tax=Rapidithrix thailandica TaxID=413964 RepID=A0AAW9RQ10_9BACT